MIHREKQPFNGFVGAMRLIRKGSKNVLIFNKLRKEFIAVQLTDEEIFYVKNNIANLDIYNLRNNYKDFLQTNHFLNGRKPYKGGKLKIIKIKN